MWTAERSFSSVIATGYTLAGSGEGAACSLGARRTIGCIRGQSTLRWGEVVRRTELRDVHGEDRFAAHLRPISYLGLYPKRGSTEAI